MSEIAIVDSEIARFEAECAAAGVSPADAIRAGGLASSTWFRWKSAATSPTLRSLSAARRGLQDLISGHDGSPSDAALVAPPADAGAEKSLTVFSTGDAA